MSTPELKTNSYPNIGQSFGIAGLMIVTMIIATPVFLLLNSYINDEAVMLIYYLVAVGIPFWIANTKRIRNSENTKYNLRIEQAGIVPLIIIATFTIVVGIITPLVSFIPIPEFVEEAMFDFAGQNGFFSFLLLIIAAPILEELIFRGIILDGLLNKYSPLKSILLSSFLFGLVHLNPWQFVTGFVIGIFSGWIYYRTRSLSLAILIHAVTNLVGFLGRILPGGDSASTEETLVEAYGGLHFFLLAIAVFIGITILCIYYINRELNKESAIDKNT